MSSPSSINMFGITADILRIAVASDLGLSESLIEILSFSISPGSKMGDNFSCDVKAVEVEYHVKDRVEDTPGQNKTSYYMAKVFPESDERIRFLKEVRPYSYSIVRVFSMTTT